MCKIRTFFEELQKNKKIDNRDARGKVHDLSLILVELVLALLSNRDGNLSSIHRHMVSHHAQVVKTLGLCSTAQKKPYLVLIFRSYWAK